MVDPFSLIKDYPVDQEDGIRQLITCFLNFVMEEEALLQAGVERYVRTDFLRNRLIKFEYLFNNRSYFSIRIL